MREHAGASNAAKPLVGLFLLLLVFFVLLTAGAPVDPLRGRQASESLAAAFPVGPTWFTGEEGQGGASGERLGTAAQQRLTRLFATELSVARVVILEYGRVMQVELPAAAMFDGDAVRLSLAPLLDRLAGELGAVSPNRRATVDLFLHTPAQAAAGRGQAFARTLVDRGAPAAAIRTGVEAGDPATLRLEFTVRRREAVALPFRDG